MRFLAFTRHDRNNRCVAGVEFQNVSKTFRGANGASVSALKRISFSIGAGELVTVVGPSGCGKTTTLRLIAGLEFPDEGSVSFGGAVANEVEPKDRDVAMVFQRDALYPHMTARENL